MDHSTVSVRLIAAFVVAMSGAGCSLFAPRPAPLPARPIAARPAAQPDWFQQQLVAARQARVTHLPKSDTAGAQAAYDGVVRAACVRVALSGPPKYQARCAAVLKQSQPEPADPFPCDEGISDPTALSVCND